METQLRSWRLTGILNAEIAAGNSIARESYGTMSFVVLEKAFMTPIRISDGVLEYREQTFDKSCFEMIYYDKETNEYLGFKAFRKFDLFKAIKGRAFKGKDK